MKLTIDVVREYNPALAHQIVKLAREHRTSVDDELLFLVQKALMPIGDCAVSAG